MKKRVTLLLSALLALNLSTNAQISCSDLNGYPQSKNTGGVGAYTLTKGLEEKASQTYHYSQLGLLTSVRIYGYTPGLGDVEMVARVYHVDANGRPTSIITSRYFNWDWRDDLNGYKDVTFFGPGCMVSSSFAVSAEINDGISLVTNFQVGYNGDGEGNSEDLASLAGTSTGNNWVSAMNNFNKNGDFYIIPKMKNFIEADFSVNASCISTGSTVTFTNESNLSTDSMFNTIGLFDYAGSNDYYSWNFGDGSPISHLANPTHSYSTPGVYTVSLTAYLDGWNNNCSDIYSRQISVGLAVSSASVNPTSCNGTADGSFIAVGSGGATPYKYSINGETYQTSASFSGLAAGTYTLYIKDNLGCIQTTTVVISQPTPVIFVSNLTTNASCGGADGAILSSGSGGVGSLQYSLNGTTWQPGGSFTGLAAGPYTVHVKDANNCSTTASVLVNDVGGPSLNINSYSNVSCYNDNDGSIIASASGGTGAYLFSVNGGSTWQSSGTFNNLVSGNYIVMVKDAVGCVDVMARSISQPNPQTFTTITTPALCNGSSTGSITVNTTSGGTGTPVYSLNGAYYQSNNTFTGLADGTYTVYVKDVAGCVVTGTAIVTEPTAISVSTIITNATCNDLSTGSIDVVVSGGTPDYSYSINGSGYYSTGDFNELGAGTYTITVMDDNECLASTVATVTQPSAITASVTVGTSTCGNANGNILIVAAGGSGSGYQYSMNGTTWSSSGSYTGLSDSTYAVLVHDGTGCSNLFYATVADADGPMINTVSSTNITCYGESDGTVNITSVSGGSGTLHYRIDASPWQTSTSFSGVAAGPHTVVVHDGLGCSGSYNLTLTQPSAIVVSTSVVNLLCNDAANGSVTITAGGGAGTLAYSLDGETFQSNNIFTGLAAGNYTAYARDAGSCIGQINFTITEPSAVSVVALGILNVDCNGNNSGAVNIVGSGGTGTLQYSINGSPYQSTGLFTNLDAGVYTINIMDANGCIITTGAAVEEPAVITTSSEVINVSCYDGNDGVIDLSVSGGISPYDYTWSTGSHFEDVFFLTAGTYNVTINDGNGCTHTAGFTVSQPSSPLVVNGVVGNATTAVSNDGSIDITVTGGTSPYFYNWSNGAFTADIYGLAPGYYILTLTDDNGCSTSGVFLVGALSGVDNETSDLNVKIYPNPSSDFITVDADKANIEKLELLDMVGQVISATTPNSGKAQLDVTSVVTGGYMVRITTEAKTFVQKIQVNH